ARRAEPRSEAIGADCFGRAVPQDSDFASGKSDSEAGSGASKLEDGPADYDRFRDADEQGFRSDRSALAVRHRARPNPGGDSPPVHDSLHGRIRGWFDPGTAWPNGYAHAHPICANLSGAGAI